MHRPLLVLLATLAIPTTAQALCFSSTGSALWPNTEVVYEIDRSALTRASMTSCLDDSLVGAFETYAVDNGIVTIEDWFLDGLQDWIEGDPDIDQPLSFRERVGDETPYLLVTSLCDLDNMVSRSSYLPGHVGEDVYYINLRPTTHEPARFEQTIRHELGHAMGMQHAQERPDRDNYVVVDDAFLNTGGYKKWSTWSCKATLYNLPYEYDSIMGYPLMPKSEDDTCDVDHPEGCIMVPVDDGDLALHLAEMEARTITEVDRWALRLHYSTHEPERLGLYNPMTSQYAFATIASYVADGNAYATTQVDDQPWLDVSAYDGVFDRDIASSSAVMVAGDWTDPEADGAEYLGVVWVERAARGYTLQAQYDLSEDMWGEDEAVDSSSLGNTVVPFVGNFDGDPNTAPGLALYDQDFDTFTYDSDGDGALDTWVWGFYTTSGSPYPVAADLMGYGFDSLCLFYQDWGVFLCDTDGDDEPDGATAFTTRTGSRIYPVVGDWNGDGIDDLGIYDADNRTWELDRNDDFTISEPDAYGQSIDLVLRAGSSEVQPEDVDLLPFAGRFDEADLDNVVYSPPWRDDWCDTIDGEYICGDAWDICYSLETWSQGTGSGPACMDPLEGTYDELPYNCWWAGAIIECTTP